MIKLLIFFQLNAYIEQSAFLDHPAVYSDHNLTVRPLNCNDTLFHIHHFSPLFSLNWILIINNITVLLVIPILDRIVYPLCCPWMPNMFSRIGAGMFFSCISILCAIIVEATRYHVFEHSSTSQVNINVFQYFQVFSVSIPVEVMAPQLWAQAVAECLTLVTSKQLVSQLLYGTKFWQGKMWLNHLTLLQSFDKENIDKSVLHYLFSFHNYLAIVSCFRLGLLCRALLQQYKFQYGKECIKLYLAIYCFYTEDLLAVARSSTIYS